MFNNLNLTIFFRCTVNKRSSNKIDRAFLQILIKRFLIKVTTVFCQIPPSNWNSRNQACAGSFTSISTQLSVGFQWKVEWTQKVICWDKFWWNVDQNVFDIDEMFWNHLWSYKLWLIIFWHEKLSKLFAINSLILFTQFIEFLIRVVQTIVNGI